MILGGIPAGSSKLPFLMQRKKSPSGEGGLLFQTVNAETSTDLVVPCSFFDNRKGLFGWWIGEAWDPVACPLWQVGHCPTSDCTHPDHCLTASGLASLFSFCYVYVWRFACLSACVCMLYLYFVLYLYFAVALPVTPSSPPGMVSSVPKTMGTSAIYPLDLKCLSCSSKHSQNGVCANFLQNIRRNI